MSPESALIDAVQPIDAGRWVVGVSGGLDSVALLHLLVRLRPDVVLVVAHLDHQFRGSESDGDRAFVVDLCARLRVECVVSRLEEWPDVQETNLEARFRQARLAFFRREVEQRNAAGVLLAQHADDRAETILLRLLRGGEAWAVDGLRGDRTLGTLRVIRPLLSVRRAPLLRFMEQLGESWREDSSNADITFARNRVRASLRRWPELVQMLLDLGDAASEVRAWIEAGAPRFADSVPAFELADLPDPIARYALRHWLLEHGIDGESLLRSHLERLLQMTRDRATSPVFELPGRRKVHLRRGHLVLGLA